MTEEKVGKGMKVLVACEECQKCPYGEFTSICDITGKPCEDTVMCNLETVYIEEEKDNENDGGEL